MDVHHSGYTIHPDGFYPEPAWCFDVMVALIGRAAFGHGVYDPCCGMGTIPAAAKALGFPSAGSDIVDRQKLGRFPFAVRDFLASTAHVGVWPAIVMNPNFTLARAFIEKALIETKPGRLVVCFAPLSFLASEKRYDLFQRPEMERVLILSNRPSIPDGDALLAGKVKRGNGIKIFCWLVFRVGGRREAKPVIDWALRGSGGDIA